MRFSLATVATASVLVLAGCGGGSSDSGGSGDSGASTTPAETMASVKTTLDKTSGLVFNLSSKGVPSSASALISGSGTLTHAPAFDGAVTVQVAGLTPQVPLIAVDGKVYAQLPLTTGWQTIDPSAYGAPNPADLMATSGGMSDWLTATTGLTKGDSVRGGAGNKEVLTTYTGTLPADSAKVLIPTVTTDLDVTYTISDDDELREVVLKGDVYGTGDTETYTVNLDDYGTTKDIKAPA